MRTSQIGIDFIKQWEALRIVAYEDIVGVWTIGYGHTGDVNPGDVISEEDAEMLLRADLAEAEDAVNDYVDVDLEQHEFDALVSFTFNVGQGNFRGSTLIKLLNAGNRDAAALQFPRWNKADGVPSKGLTRRRHAEQLMFEGLS